MEHETLFARADRAMARSIEHRVIRQALSAQGMRVRDHLRASVIESVTSRSELKARRDDKDQDSR